ncbi:MAG: DUF4282 domain-containing protein [Maricaulaceae bacterium]
MTNILNFFLSFDKMMKEKLVRAFYWLALIAIALTFGATMFENIWLGPLAGILRFVGFFVMLLLSVVSLRLLCEALIALFRINDNLSPDGGKGETADVDLLEEARKAAEVATAKARDAAKTAGEKTRSALDKTKDAASDLGEKVEKKTTKSADTVKTKTRTKTVKAEDITIEPPKKAPAKKTTAKKAPAKKTTAKKASAKSSGGVRLKKDGTPYKKRVTKPKS